MKDGKMSSKNRFMTGFGKHDVCLMETFKPWMACRRVFSFTRVLFKLEHRWLLFFFHPKTSLSSTGHKKEKNSKEVNI